MGKQSSSYSKYLLCLYIILDANSGAGYEEYKE